MINLCILHWSSLLLISIKIYVTKYQIKEYKDQYRLKINLKLPQLTSLDTLPRIDNHLIHLHHKNTHCLLDPQQIMKCPIALDPSQSSRMIQIYQDIDSLPSWSREDNLSFFFNLTINQLRFNYWSTSTCNLFISDFKQANRYEN